LRACKASARIDRADIRRVGIKTGCAARANKSSRDHARFASGSGKRRLKTAKHTGSAGKDCGSTYWAAQHVSTINSGQGDNVVQK